MSAELPEGWTGVSLVELISFVIGGDWGKGEQEKPADWLPARIIRGTEFRGWEQHKGSTGATRFLKPSSLEKRQLRVGDLVLEVSGGGPDQSVGRTMVIDDDAISRSPFPLSCTNFCRLVRFTGYCDSRYVNFCLKWLYKQGHFDKFQNQTVNIRNLEFPRFASETDIPLPPLAEQRRIVAKVEQILARVNAARERLGRVPATLKRFRQSVLAAACSGRLTADWREEHRGEEPAGMLIANILEDRRRRFGAATQTTNGDRKESGRRTRDLNRQEVACESLPELPHGWEWVTWNDLADWITYGFTRPMPHVADGIPIVSAKTVRDGYFDFDEIERTTGEAFASLSEKDKPRRGEILITKDGAIRGRAAIVNTDEPFCITQAVALVRFGGMTADPQYLLHVIQSSFTQKLIDEESSGTAIPHISITSFGRFPIPLPPLAEQREIVRRVSALFALADGIEAKLAAARKRVDALTQAVLAKAFRGELVPTEAGLARAEGRSYEPASALLGRVRAERDATPKPARLRKRS